MTTNQSGSFTGKRLLSPEQRTASDARRHWHLRARASVVAADVSEGDNQETARMIEELGGRSLAIR
jgi:hypothetical protein